MKKIKNKKLGKLYVITDNVIQNRYDHVKLAALICKGGADMIQFREKKMSTYELIETAKRIKRICTRNKVMLIINDRADIALYSDADGVHLGKDDIPVSEARKLLGIDKIIGATAHNFKEAKQAEKDGADYIGYGHIYKTYTKDKKDKPKGLKKLKDIVNKINIPVYAIGGISPDNIYQVLETGAAGAAIAGAVVRSPKPDVEIKRLRTIINTKKK